MTQIHFYTHVADKLRLVSQLCQKAMQQSARVYVLTSDEAAHARVSASLWGAGPTAFLAHCEAAAAAAAFCPIIVDHRYMQVHDQILINLTAECPPAFSRFERLIEIVSLDAEDAEAARARWRHYKSMGYEIISHNMQQR